MKREVNSWQDKTYWNQNLPHDLYFKCVSTGKKGLQKKKKNEPGREEAKLELYDRKHSNLLLITAGPSSSGTPDREEDSSSTKLCHRSALPTSQLETPEFICNERPGGQALHRKHRNDISLPLFTENLAFQTAFSDALSGGVWCSNVVTAEYSWQLRPSIHQYSVKARYTIDLPFWCWSHSLV